MAKVIKGNRGGKVLVVDGYRYQNRGIVGGNMGWQCWRRKECNASLKTSIFEVREGPVDPKIRVIRHHSHEPDDGVIERAEQREEMIASIKQNPCTPVGRVYKSQSVIYLEETHKVEVIESQMLPSLIVLSRYLLEQEVKVCHLYREELKMLIFREHGLNLGKTKGFFYT